MLKAISSITNALGALNYKGTWNASSNTPTLADGTGAKGDYYVVSTAGTQTFGGIQLFFGTGDWIAYNGAVWQRVEGGSDGNFANVTLTSTDAGANEAPTLDLYRDSASPTAADTLAEIQFNGEDSAGNKQKYACIHGSILSPTSGSEQGQIHFETQTAGASTEKMIIGTTNLVINDIGAVFNVRIEGDTDANLFYTDATNSRVGIGTASPATKLDVSGTATISGTTTLSGLTASTDLALDASKNIVSVVNPTFSAYGSTGQNISTATFTKVTLGSEDYDTNSNFASSTFTPTVAGYYQLNLKLAVAAATSLTRVIAEFRQNGDGANNGRCLDITAALSTSGILNATNIMLFNGSTDYCEIWVYLDGVGQMSVSSNDKNTTFFQGSMIRRA